MHQHVSQPIRNALQSDAVEHIARNIYTAIIAPCATVLTALALVVATGGLNAAEQVPKFKQNTLYPDARASLLKLGWQPVPVPAASKRCDQHQNICEAYPEAESCEPIGVVTCSMLWMHGEEIIRVSTISDNNIMVLPGVATLWAVPVRVSAHWRARRAWAA